MNKLWAIASSLALVAQICAVTEKVVPATFNYQDREYRLSTWDSRQIVYLPEDAVVYLPADALGACTEGILGVYIGSRGDLPIPIDEVAMNIFEGTDADYALFKGHEDEVIEAVLRANCKNGIALWQLRHCSMFDRKIGHAPTYWNFVALQKDQQLRDQQLQRDQFLKTRVIPAVAIAAAVGIAIKYRAALKRVATKAKDRIVAWWHGSEKKAERPKAVQHKSAATA